MQPSRSLGAMHTRRLHGRSASSQVSTSSLPDFGTNYNLDHEPDQAGMGTSLLKRAQSQIDGTATKGASLGWAGKAGSASGPLRTGSLSTIAILLKWRWTWSRISIATYVVFSVILFSWSLIYSSDPGLSQGKQSVDERRILSRLIPHSSFLQAIATPPAGSMTHSLNLNTSVSACIIIKSEDLLRDPNRLHGWRKRWNGPIQLLVTTSMHPQHDVAGYKSLSRRLLSIYQHLVKRDDPRPMSIQLIYLSTSPTIAPSTNQLMNLLRLSLSTSTIKPSPIASAPQAILLLIPTGLEYLPAQNLSTTLLTSELPIPSILPLRNRTKNTSSAGIPIAHSKSRIPKSYLEPESTSALLIDANDPIWCTERFFLSTSTTVSNEKPWLDEWSECLWEVALVYPDAMLSGGGDEYFAHGKTVVWTDDDDSRVDTMRSDAISQTSASEDSSVRTQIHKRMQTQFRSEQCMVVARQFSARGLWGTSAINNAGGDAVAKKAIDHVKAMCGETLKLWGKYLLE